MASLDIAPHFDETIELPLPVIEPLPGVEYFLNLSFRTREVSPLVPRGHEVAWEQFKLPVDEPESAVELARAAKLTPHENDNELRIVGEKFSVTFDKTTGEILSMTYGGDGVVPSGPVPNFWRAPTDNDFGNDMPERLGIWREAGRRERLKKCRYVRTRTEISSSMSWRHFRPVGPGSQPPTTSLEAEISSSRTDSSRGRWGFPTCRGSV